MWARVRACVRVGACMCCISLRWTTCAIHIGMLLNLKYLHLLKRKCESAQLPSSTSVGKEEKKGTRTQCRRDTNPVTAAWIERKRPLLFRICFVNKRLTNRLVRVIYTQQQIFDEETEAYSDERETLKQRKKVVKRRRSARGSLCLPGLTHPVTAKLNSGLREQLLGKWSRPVHYIPCACADHELETMKNRIVMNLK